MASRLRRGDAAASRVDRLRRARRDLHVARARTPPTTTTQRRRTCSGCSAACCRSALSIVLAADPPLRRSSGRGCSATSASSRAAAIALGRDAAAPARPRLGGDDRARLRRLVGAPRPRSRRRSARRWWCCSLTALYNVLGRLWPDPPARDGSRPMLSVLGGAGADRRRRARPVRAQPARPDARRRRPRDRHHRAALPGRRRAQLGRRRAAGAAGAPPRHRPPRAPLVRARRGRRASTSACSPSPTCWRSPTPSSRIVRDRTRRRRRRAVGAARRHRGAGRGRRRLRRPARARSRAPPSRRRRRSSRCSASTWRWSCSSPSAAPGRRSSRWRRSPRVSSPGRGTSLHFTLETGTVAVVAELAIYVTVRGAALRADGGPARRLAPRRRRRG